MPYNPFRPDVDTFSLGRGDAEVMLKDTGFFTMLGEAESIKIKPDFQEIERFSKSFGKKVSIRKDIIQVGGTIEAVLLQRTKEVRQIIYQGLERTVERAAVDAEETAFANVTPGGKIPLGKGCVVAEVKVANVIVPATAYRVDPQSGDVQLRDGGTGTVTWSAPAGSRKRIGGFSTNGLEGTFRFRGANAIGFPELVTVWKTTFKLSSDVDLLGGDDYDQVTITGTMAPDETQENPDDALFIVEPLTDLA